MGEDKENSGILGLGESINYVDNLTKIDSLNDIKNISIGVKQAIVSNYKDEIFTWGTSLRNENSFQGFSKFYTPTKLKMINYLSNIKSLKCFINSTIIILENNYMYYLGELSNFNYKKYIIKNDFMNYYSYNKKLKRQIHVKEFPVKNILQAEILMNNFLILLLKSGEICINFNDQLVFELFIYEKILSIKISINYLLAFSENYIHFYFFKQIFLNSYNSKDIELKIFKISNNVFNKANFINIINQKLYFVTNELMHNKANIEWVLNGEYNELKQVLSKFADDNMNVKENKDELKNIYFGNIDLFLKKNNVGEYNDISLSNGCNYNEIINTELSNFHNNNSFSIEKNIELKERCLIKGLYILDNVDSNNLERNKNKYFKKIYDYSKSVFIKSFLLFDILNKHFKKNIYNNFNKIYLYGINNIEIKKSKNNFLIKLNKLFNRHLSYNLSIFIKNYNLTEKYNLRKTKKNNKEIKINNFKSTPSLLNKNLLNNNYKSNIISPKTDFNSKLNVKSIIDSYSNRNVDINNYNNNKIKKKMNLELFFTFNKYKNNKPKNNIALKKYNNIYDRIKKLNYDLKEQIEEKEKNLYDIKFKRHF